jgi:hypothetical protein
VWQHCGVFALARVGLIILALGLFADLVYHSLPDLTEFVFGSGGVRAHLVVFVGMVVVICGVVQQGFIQSNPRVGTPQSSRRELKTSHAHR